MNAIELHDRVSRMPSPPPFVLLTGGAFTPHTQAFLERTELPVLHKPIDARPPRVRPGAARKRAAARILPPSRLTLLAYAWIR